ncbi:MAG: hypothetical protein Q8S11_05595 [Daejeonella sp.]|uniref:hypothetical protein n=1 Tax=Daejeonella sp. TaxID=2805397 RepID=UPI002733778C|nr:hypothetical protein [Daejeonella sp.]MDP3467786.1 hypothetical protein [Daejeonella sp.]
MNAIYTVCTYNHIGRALSLADSVSTHCQDTKFIICLIDTVDSGLIPEGIELITAQEMNLSFLNEMCSKYSPLELNSALKPYFGNYIFEKYKELDQLIFLDSDILLFDDLHPVYESLSSNSIVLSPHSLSSVPDGTDFDDRVFLRSGIYNAGFFGLKRDQNSKAFLDWWMGKLRNECFFDSKRGMFAEQLWLNLVPLYFESVDILKHVGCNVAYWNLHDRILSKNDGVFYVNGSVPLIFFHYSGASISCIEENRVSQHQQRYTFTNRPDLFEVFKLYTDSLNKHSYEKFNQVYTLNSSFRTRSTLVKAVGEFYKKVIKKLFYIK